MNSMSEARCASCGALHEMDGAFTTLHCEECGYTGEPTEVLTDSDLFIWDEDEWDADDE